MNKLPTEPKQRQLTIGAAIVAATFILSATLFATGPDAAPVATQERAWSVSVQTVNPRALAPAFKTFGKLEAPSVARLRSDHVAPIAAVYVKEGQWVEAGAELVKLDDRELNLLVLERDAELKQTQATLAARRAELKLEQRSGEHFTSRHEVAQAKLKRHENLMAKRLISRALLDEVKAQANQASIEYQNHLRELSTLPNDIAALEAQVAKAQALKDQAALNLERSIIYAPFAGPVLAVHVAPGDHTNLSVPLVEVADLSQVEVRVQIPDAYVDQFRTANIEGAQISAHTANGPMQLARMARHVRSGQTGVDAFFTFAGETPVEASIGRVIDVEITLPQQQGVVALPVQSIYDNRKIFKVVDDRLIGLDIERVGEFNGDQGYQILVRTPALAAGDHVITTQLPRAIDGLLVDVANQVETLDPSASL